MKTLTPEQIADEIITAQDGQIIRLADAGTLTPEGMRAALVAAVNADRARRTRPFAATSSEDRYDAARAALAEYDTVTAARVQAHPRRLAETLRALIDHAEINETPEQAARRVYFTIHSFPWLVDGDAMRDLIQRGYLAGIQAAWESWEPENAPGVPSGSLEVAAADLAEALESPNIYPSNGRYHQPTVAVLEKARALVALIQGSHA